MSDARTKPVRPELVEGHPTHRRRSLLAELNHHIAHVAPARHELKSVQAFRETWSRIATEEQVTNAVQRGPENAGPLNSQMLVLRTLGLLRELSPHYLRHFVAHADALLWLDQLEGRLRPTRKGKSVRRLR